MSRSSENRSQSGQSLWVSVLLVLVLYILQGVTLGVADSMSVYLASLGATWKQQTILSLMMYAFSIKLLWAPLIDVFYIRWLGRRRTWLIPIQVILGVIFIILSFHLELLIVQLRVTDLAVIFFFIKLLLTIHDISVDGWALTLFTSSNVIWQAISQMIGQSLGYFVGNSVLLTFESANMTNRLIRQPFGIANQPYGLFTLTQFIRFWAVMFFIAACVITFLFREQQQNTDANQKENNDDHLSLLETYLYVVRLFKKKCILQSLLIIICPTIGFAATSTMTTILLVSRGLITREALGLVTMPLILTTVTMPLLLSRTRRPLIIYTKSYAPRLVVCILIAIFVLFGTSLQSYPIVFYTLLIVLLGLDDALGTLQATTRSGFCAAISDTRIGSTYYTLFASLNNLGFSMSRSAVFYTASWLPKEYAYYIEVSVCFLLGCVWLCTSWRLIQRLQGLPVDCWHLSLQKAQLNGDYHDDHQITTTNIRQSQLPMPPTGPQLSVGL